MNFDEAFQKLVDPQHEGGYVNNPADPGGETKYGISKRSYPDEDIKNLTLDRAKEIYSRDYWAPSGGHVLPELLKYEMFDLAINTSSPGKPVTAIRLLQQAVGTDVDGVLGPQTIMAAQAVDPNKALRRLQALRIRYYTSLRDGWWQEFGKGVMNRVAANMLEA